MKLFFNRNYFKILILIPFLALASYLPILPASAASPVVVTVSCPMQPVSHGQQFTVYINVQPNNAIAGAQFNLTFNPSLVSINSVTEGNLFNQGAISTYFMAGTINNTAGTLTNVADVITTPGQTESSSGTLAVITMTAAAASGTCALSLSNVVVGDINGNSLAVTLVNGQVINTPPSIATSTLPAWTVGVVYSQTLAATGGTAPYTWTIASGTLPAGLSLSSNGVISGTPTTAGGPISVAIQVTDSTGATATESMSLTINLALNIITSSLPTWTAGMVYSQTLVSTGGTAPYTWTIVSGTLPPGLSFASSGIVSGVPTTAGGPTTVTYKITDNTSATATKSLSITINTALNVTSSSLPAWTINKPYSQTLNATGGTPPYSWTIASGTLPAGLSLSSGGIISGTSTIAGGPTLVTFKVTDAATATANKSLALTINAAPSIASSSLSTLTIGAAYSQTLAVTGGTAPYTWALTAGMLPTGLSLSSSGAISGTPTTSGSSTSITVSVTDSANATANKTLTVPTIYAAWDVNMDGSVNVLDLILIAEDFSQTGTPGWIREDVNGDGAVNIDDLIIVGQRWTG
jgi:Putative Ig domain/Cohesin domain